MQNYNARARRLRIESHDEAQEILRLLNENEQFFTDLLDLQQYFSDTISPVLPLNTTWNPLCTRRFGGRGAEGLRYVYSNNEQAEYRRLMKQQMSAAWTGFNRFPEEPWEKLRPYIDQSGNLLDIGSSVGLSALEIVRALEMKGVVMLIDREFPLRMVNTVRIVDYNDPGTRLLGFKEAETRMEHLQGDRVVMALFGVDFSQPLREYFDLSTKQGSSSMY